MKPCLIGLITRKCGKRAFTQLNITKLLTETCADGVAFFIKIMENVRCYLLPKPNTYRGFIDACGCQNAQIASLSCQHQQ